MITKQSFADQCDINKIMAKYQKTGLIDHVTKHSAEYGVHTQRDLLEAYEVIERAEEMFADLPSKARETFGNDPGKFLAYMEDANIESRAGELLEMGLLDPNSETAQAVLKANETVVSEQKEGGDPPPSKRRAGLVPLVVNRPAHQVASKCCQNEQKRVGNLFLPSKGA